MTKKPSSRPFYDPGLQSLLPFFYAAWSDKKLSAKEVEALRQMVAEADLLRPAEKQVATRWSDPGNPPSRELFKHWEIVLHRSARELPEADKGSLVALGLAMARQSARQLGRRDIDKWDRADIKNLLDKLRQGIGELQPNTLVRIFGPPQADWKETERQKASFDSDRLARRLDGAQYAFRRELQQLLREPVFQGDTPRIKEEYREQVLQWCKLLGRKGYGALSYPPAYGGKEDWLAYGTVFETLAQFDLSLIIKYGVQFGLFGGSIYWLGTKYHHDKYLKRAGQLDLPGCFAMTETGHGSNVRGLETTATYDPERAQFIVHTPRLEAGKEYIGNALHGQLATVFCQLIVDGENQGVHAILVPLRDEEGHMLPGIRVEDNGYKMGLNGIDNGRIWFDQVRVPRENLLDRHGAVSAEGVYSSPIADPSKRFFTMLGTLVGGRVFVPRAGLGAAKLGLTIAIRYALQRRQFGPSYTEPETLLIDYPTHQRRLIPPLAKAYALHFALADLTDRYAQREAGTMRELETLAAGLKAYATWFTTESLQECREACGGKGYLAENRFAALKADTDIFTTFEGDNVVLMQLVARGRLTHFRKEFSEEGVMGILRYLGSNLATTLRERNPLIIRNTDRKHLLDQEFHRNAFSFREERLLFTVSQRLRSLIKADTPAYEAYLQCQTHMLALAEAFIEHYVLRQFQNALDQCANGPVKAVLTRLCQLFALHTIEKHKGWFLEKGYMEGSKTRAIRRLVDELCAELRGDALPLVDAFGIPEHLIGAPIA